MMISQRYWCLSSPESVNKLRYIANTTFPIWLSQKSGDGKIVLDYLDGPSINNHRVKELGTERCPPERDSPDNGWIWKQKPPRKAWGLEASRKWILPLSTRKEIQPCWHLGVSSQDHVRLRPAELDGSGWWCSQPWSWASLAAAVGNEDTERGLRRQASDPPYRAPAGVASDARVSSFKNSVWFE